MIAFLQGPGVIKAVFGSFRGYAGNISAAGALDAVSNDGNTLIIDIRQALGSPLFACRSGCSSQQEAALGRHAWPCCLFETSNGMTLNVAIICPLATA